MTGFPCEAEYSWDTTDDCCYAPGGPGDPSYSGGSPPPAGKGDGNALMGEDQVEALAKSLSARLKDHNPAAITFAILGWLAFLASAIGNYFLYVRVKGAGGRARVNVGSSYQAPTALTTSMQAPLSAHDAARGPIS